MKKTLPVVFALGWAVATYFIVGQFTDRVTGIAQAAAQEAALATFSKIRPEIEKLCNQIQELQPSYDRDEPSSLCNTVALSE